MEESIFITVRENDGRVNFHYSISRKEGRQII